MTKMENLFLIFFLICWVVFVVVLLMFLTCAGGWLGLFGFISIVVGINWLAFMAGMAGLFK